MDCLVKELPLEEINDSIHDFSLTEITDVINCMNNVLEQLLEQRIKLKNNLGEHNGNSNWQIV